MTNSAPQLYDIWRLAFEYEDQPGKVKERPVVIGALDSKHAVVLAVKVTSHGARLSFPGEVRIEDWVEAGLEKPSVARCSKTLIVPVEAFAGQQRYGALSDRDALAISRALRDVGATLYDE